MEWLTFALDIVPKLVLELIKLLRDTGKDVRELRKQPMTVSVSFGGGEGDAIVVQREIEALLPDEDPPTDSSTR